MNNNVLRLLITVGALVAVRPALATDWSTQAYDLYFGDFNGDGKTDVLYIAKDPSGISGINLSDGSGPNIPLQSWSSNYLNIPWSGNHYTVIIADINGDGRSDILLQSNTPGDNYLLLANPEGKFVGIEQTVSNSTAGVVWSADQHRIVAGDFNHDGKADVFLQATSSSGLNAVILADGSGHFTATSPAQSWNDGFLGLKWATKEAWVYAGNFDGRNGADLLIQAKPVFVMIDNDVPFPIPTYPSNLNGVVLSQPAAPFFQLSGLQTWSRLALGVDWSPLKSNIIVEALGGTGQSGVLLQGKFAGTGSYLLTTNSSGPIFNTGTLLASNVTWTANTYRLSSVNFTGSSTGVYMQAVVAGAANFYTNSVTDSSVSTTQSTLTAEGTVVEYVYDALGRLTTVMRSGATAGNGQTSYNYDPTGNRTSVTSTATP
jgi:YD repeat-containing protein